ncbi:MAG TPA: TonB-dependent receptor [Anaerovoracaceae bacterium]|nr:TonB-dependent receptor [Anaerovoracaceae bacterium]
MKNSCKRGVVPLIRNVFKYIFIVQFLILFTAAKGIDFTDGIDPSDLQQQGITGTVTDNQNGQTMAGVNIVIKGSTVGTMTDANGKYSISVPDRNAVLVFSFIGYASIEVPVSGNTVVNASLVPETLSLEEVVVVGYGTQRKETLTGSITAVRNEELTHSPVIGVSNSLAGLLPGVVAVNRSGQPGNVSSILIRGRNTTGDNDPLVVVDGIPGYSGWQYINPEDIESISVLKDASAAIYGSRAANGVILITTKRGKAGKPTINYSFNEGLSQLTRVPEMADAVLYAQFVNEYKERFGQAHFYSDEEIQKFKSGTDPFYPNTDWYAETLKKFTPQRQHSLNMTGGTDRLNYLVSGSYSFQDGIFKSGASYFKTYSLIARVDGKINDNIKVGFDLNTALDDNYNTGYPFSSLGQNLPTIPVYWPNGEPSSGIAAGNNPAIEASEISGYVRNKDQRYSAKASIDINIPWVKGLGADGYFVYVNNTGLDKTWSKPYNTYSYVSSTQTYSLVKGGPTTPQLTQASSNNSSTLTYFRVKYEKRINDHNINAFIAFEQSVGVSNNFSARRVDFYSNVIDQLFAGGLTNQVTNGSASESARQNYFGRLNYGFREKYLLDFNFRYDGSSNFPKDKRWGFFPGASVAWRLSKENFIRDNLGFITDLKLRGSYGQIGNDRVPSFQWLSTYSLGSTGYTFGMSPVTTLGLRAGVTPNPSITWEVAEIMNAGLDANFWKGLLGITVDLFKQRRSNILAKRDLAIPGNTGLILPYENIGIVENKGIEIELTHQRIVGEFSYKIEGNVAYARNRIIDISEAENVPVYQKAEGHALGADSLYKAIGIIRTEEELNSIPIYPGSRVGDLKYEDVDKDGLISDADMVRVDQTSTPEITFGASISMSYRQFSLWAHFSGQSRAWVQFHKFSKGAGHNSLKELLENRYTPGSMTSKYPIIPDSETTNMDINGFPSTFWQMDASFIRLKTLELSYTLPKDLLAKAKINSMRVFLSGTNVFTIDKLKWYDPEGDRTIGDFYPQSKVYNLGIRISF